MDCVEQFIFTRRMEFVTLFGKVAPKILTAFTILGIRNLKFLNFSYRNLKQDDEKRINNI